ncbi:MAG TPA: FG-GAP-like repeat-containing protein [Pyrinomonadaceae bacterium]
MGKFLDYALQQLLMKAALGKLEKRALKSRRVFLLALLLTAAVTITAAADGSLDPSFGSGGKTIVQMAAEQVDLAKAAAVQADGKIVLGGEVGSYSLDTNRAGLVRLNADGSLDPSFGSGGRVVNPGQIHLSGLVIQPDGKIVTAGATHPVSITDDFAVVRYNADGSLDTSFGSGGYAVNGDGEAQTVLLQPDGKILLVGFVTLFRNGSDFILARFNPDGSVDPTFGVGGRVQTSFTSGRNSDDHALSAALQTDGKIVVSGSITGVPTVLIRYNSNGSVDTGFGLDGSVLTPNTGITARRVIVQPDGKIVIGGSSFGLRRYNANGTTDQTFTGGGGSFGGTIYLHDIGLQSDGKLLAAGGVCYTNTGECNFLLARYNPNGGLDPTFGTSGGFVITNITEGTLDEAFALVLQPDGKIVLAGYASEPGGSYVDFAAARYLNLAAPSSARRPAQFDFDGDRQTDVSIYRSGMWYLNETTSGYTAMQFGLETDKIVPADFDGDGKTDIAVFRPSEGNWYCFNSLGGTYSVYHFGQSGDIPQPADYTGDGRADYAVYRDGTWYIAHSSGESVITQFGISTDKPVAADFDGDGKADIAVFRPSDGSWWYLQSSDQQFKVYRFGVGTDKPVQGDYTGDGKAELAVFRPSTGEWFFQRSEDNSYYSFVWGQSGDKPAAGDYDGDGRADAAVFRPGNSTWYMNQTTAGIGIVTFGSAGDLPVPNAFVP